MAQEQDILKRPAPKRPPRLTSRRIGIHTSSAGGVQNAAERAYRLGCNTFQIFSSSPRQWAPYELGQPQCAEMNRLRAQYDLHAEGIAKRVREFVGPRRYGTIGEFAAMVDEITRDIPDEEMRKLPSSDRIDEIVYGIKPRAAVK